MVVVDEDRAVHLGCCSDQQVGDAGATVVSKASTVPLGPVRSLEHAARVHDNVDAGARARVLLAIPD